MSKLKQYAMYASLGLVTLGFGAAGLAKLAGVEQMHLSFAAMGLPVWFGYFIGASEVAGAIGVWVKRVCIPAAVGLIAVMFGAIYYHLFLEVPANVIPAIALSALAVNIIFNRLQKRESHE